MNYRFLDLEPMLLLDNRNLFLEYYYFRPTKANDLSALQVSSHRFREQRPMKCVSYVPAGKSSKEFFLWLVKGMFLNKKMTEHCKTSSHFLACVLHVAFYYYLIPWLRTLDMSGLHLLLHSKSALLPFSSTCEFISLLPISDKYWKAMEDVGNGSTNPKGNFFKGNWNTLLLL